AARGIRQATDRVVLIAEVERGPGADIWDGRGVQRIGQDEVAAVAGNHIDGYRTGAADGTGDRDRGVGQQEAAAAEDQALRKIEVGRRIQHTAQEGQRTGAQLVRGRDAEPARTERGGARVAVG